MLAVEEDWKTSFQVVQACRADIVQYQRCLRFRLTGKNIFEEAHLSALIQDTLASGGRS